MKSAAHSATGLLGLKSRSTRSAGRDAAGSERVVRMLRPRRAPCKPSTFVGRSTVQQATRTPSRFSLQPHLPGAVHTVVLVCTRAIASSLSSRSSAAVTRPQALIASW